MDNSEIPKQRLTGRVWCDFSPVRIRNFAVQNLHLKIFDEKVHFFLEQKITERRLRWSEGTGEFCKIGNICTKICTNRSFEYLMQKNTEKIRPEIQSGSASKM